MFLRFSLVQRSDRRRHQGTEMREVAVLVGAFLTEEKYLHGYHGTIWKNPPRVTKTVVGCTVFTVSCIYLMIIINKQQS